MLDKLQKIEARLAQVEQQLADPSVYSDRQAMAKLSREQKELTPVVEAYRAYARAEADMAAATEMLSDPELRELGQEELSAAKAERERLEGELKRLLLPKDPNDEKNVVLEIRAGIGGEEGALFAADLLRMYTMYAERKGFALDVVSINETELGGVKEAVATVEGAGDRVLRSYPDLRRYCGSDAGGGGGGVFHRSQGSADRHLPFLRRRRTAR